MASVSVSDWFTKTVDPSAVAAISVRRLRGRPRTRGGNWDIDVDQVEPFLAV